MARELTMTIIQLKFKLTHKMEDRRKDLSAVISEFSFRSNNSLKETTTEDPIKCADNQTVKYKNGKY